MSSEIEVVSEVESRDAAVAATPSADEDNLKNDVYTAAAYGDMEKLERLVRIEGCSVTQPDSLGYYALQWASLNNRPAAAQYIIQVCVVLLMFSGGFRVFGIYKSGELYM